MKTANEDNVRYLSERYGRKPDTTEKIISVEYNYAYAIALMGSVWNINIVRHFVENFARPVLYMQDMLGMKEVKP